jgi:hypothetical protein
LQGVAAHDDKSEAGTYGRAVASLKQAWKFVQLSHRVGSLRLRVGS